MEYAPGLDGNNFVTVLMKTWSMDIQAASDYIGNHYKMLVDDFLSSKTQLPSFGLDVNADVVRFIESVLHWAIGNLLWSFETPRYFGAARQEVQRTRLVYLKPREDEKKKYYLESKVLDAVDR